MRNAPIKTWAMAALAALTILLQAPAAAQQRDPSDRADPSVVERDFRETAPERPRRAEGQVRVTERPSGAAAAGAEIVVGAIRIAGNDAVASAAFAPVLERYLGRPLGHPDLVRLATDIAGVARSRGYGLATAWVPAQDVADGVLVVQLEEGRIDAVRASGSGAAHAERVLASLASDRPVRTVDLERRLLVAADMPGLWVGDARLVREGGRNILTVNTRFERILGRVSLDNWGDSFVGPVRLRGQADVNNLLTAGDSLSLGAAVTPLQPRELQLVDGRYRIVVDGAGTQAAIGGYFGRTRAGGTLRDRDFLGDSSEVDVELSHPLERARAGSTWIGTRFALRDSELTEAGSLVRDDRIVSAALWLYSNGRFAGGKVRLRIAGISGLDLFGATERGDALASRVNAGGVFTKFEYWADYARRLGGGFSVELATRGQLSDRPLLSSEELGLGGRQFLRGFDYREVSGDDGAAASAELRFDMSGLPRQLRQVQLYSFVDGGRVRDLSSTRPAQELASAGFGLRVHTRGNIEANGEIGIPLTDGVFDRDPDPRLSFSLGIRF